MLADLLHIRFCLLINICNRNYRILYFKFYIILHHLTVSLPVCNRHYRLRQNSYANTTIKRQQMASIWPHYNLYVYINDHITIWYYKSGQCFRCVRNVKHVMHQSMWIPRGAPRGYPGDSDRQFGTHPRDSDSVHFLHTGDSNKGQCYLTMLFRGTQGILLNSDSEL